MVSSVFTVIDYTIFALTLFGSVGIGIYFGCCGTKQKLATEFLYGQGTMKPIPIGLSLFSSYISTITLIGAPSEIYTFGTQFFMNYIGVWFSLIIVWNFVLPVFCGELKLKTPYEYFEKRFNNKICLLAATIYILHSLIYLPIVLYSAIISFSEITEISLVLCITVIGGFCVFYTILGGFSAVIWSDSLQATLMLVSCLFIMIKGILKVGSIDEVWSRAKEGQRINFFNLDFNPFVRLTFWSAVIGMTFYHSAYTGFGAGALQRFMALKTEKQAKISSIVGTFCTTIVGITACTIGLTMFAEYYKCDPVENKEISSYNKLFSYYVVNIVKDTPGVLGFFTAGLLSAGLSTLSAELNSVSGLIFHCFIKKFTKKSIGEKQGALIMKIIVFFHGILCLIIAPFLDKAKYIFPFALSLTGVTYGAKIGMMILGTTFPRSNSMGVLTGVITGIILIGWINFGAIYYDVAAGDVLKFSVDNCTNISTPQNLNISMSNEPLLIYKLSFMYYPVLGTIITILVGLFVSFLTGGNDVTKMDSNLFIPAVRLKRKINESYNKLNQTMM